MSMFFFSAEKTTNHVSSLEKQFYNLQIICNLPDVQLGALRPTSNRAYIRYDHTVHCFQFVRVRLKRECDE